MGTLITRINPPAKHTPALLGEVNAKLPARDFGVINIRTQGLNVPCTYTVAGH
jgi:hypothetical protein